MDPPMGVLPAVLVRMPVAPALVTMPVVSVTMATVSVVMAPVTVTMATMGVPPSTVMTPRPLVHPPRRADGGRIGPAQPGGSVDAETR